jgi:RNA polymerase sigma-70 factor (ECF subfamily)
VLTEETSLDGARYVEQADSLSMAFLLVLERLSPVERAVFLLHDVFDYGYDEIARIVGKSEANCRQLAARARHHVREEKLRFEASREQRDELAARFVDALGDGDVDSLVELLAADAAVYSDGGGKAPSWTQPIFGRDRVIRLLAALPEAWRELGFRMRRTEINGQPGLMLFDRSDLLVTAWTFEIADGRVQTIRAVINPDKLRHLAPLADARAIGRELGEHRRTNRT